MNDLCPRFYSEFKYPMFHVDEEMSNGRLDLEETFRMNKGLCSAVGIVKLLLFLLSGAILVHSFYIHQAPLFFPAFLTCWGLFFSVGYVMGSFLLTIRCSSSSSCSSTITTPDRLTKFTWVLFSMSSVFGCVVTVLYWAFRPIDATITVESITTHGGILLLVLVQGLLVERVPMRLKHSVFTMIFGAFYIGWLAVQNVVIQYNPLDDDDDDAIYDVFRWREDALIQTLIFSLIILFGIIPFFTMLLWALSLPGRRYLSVAKNNNLEGDEARSSVSTSQVEEFESSNVMGNFDIEAPEC